MFKPGEAAQVRGSERIVTIVPGSPASSHQPMWPVATSEGVYDETELTPAHPTVLATASGRDLSAEAFRAEVQAHVGAVTDESVSFELRMEVEQALLKAALDLNSHWKKGAALKDFKLEHLFLSRHDLNVKDAKDLIQAAETGTPLDRWIPLDVGLRHNGLRTCSYCGENDFETETNGLMVRITGAPCRYPDGLPPNEWELNVPSGRLVVANDLRRIFPLPDDESHDINTTAGCRQTTLDYAANGLSHAFVSNTCPGVYECPDGSFKIANEPSDERWNGKKYVKVRPRPKFVGERRAGICTDLWWYSICDHDEYERRRKHFKHKAKDFNVEIIDVKPGVYRFQHDDDACRHDGPQECIYTTFAWVREPDPIKDYLAQYEAVEVNAHAYVHAQVARWPTLYGRTVDQGAWQRVADHVMCTIGGGVEWHAKGFPTARVDPSIPDVEPPHFRAQHHWYPFSRPYGGLFEPKLLAPSFAKLAFRVLESVISFGTDVRDEARSRGVHYTRERMTLAVKRYRELVKKYPEQADPEYVAWLGQEGRAEAWVEKFPLGPEITDKHRKHVAQQRWVPEDAYAIAFDSRKLKDGHFAHDPKVMGGWAVKKDAKRYAILQHEDNGQQGDYNCFWTCHAVNTAVPLYVVARVVRVGEVSHMGETLVEIAFDFGTPWMLDTKKRKAVPELKEKPAIKVLSREEYEQLLPEAIAFFEQAEAKVQVKG